MIQFGKKRLCVSIVPAASLLFASAVATAQYDPPPGYYAGATGTGAVLESALNSIIDNHVIRTYGDARFALQLIDRDPADASRVIQIYSGDSVPGVWDSGVTWNREHQWPRSRGINSTGADNSDLHNLRPADPGVNSSRGNLPFGVGGGFWDPGALGLPSVNDRGDVSRAMFYMAVRYDGSDASTTDLELVNGSPGTNQMGDLAKMIEWHFSDPVDDIERRRNHLIWSSADNPSYFQGNRNPFIDHPEYVWAVFGATPNDSKLYFGGVAPGDGVSSEVLAFRAIVGSVPPAQTVTLNKTGSSPTTYDIIAAGDVITASTGIGMTFAGGVQNRVIDVATVSTAIVGSQSGTITVDNTDLTTASVGMGVADGDDVISVSLDVVDPSEGSLDGLLDQNAMTIDFGTFGPDSGVVTQQVSIFNLEATPGFTASLDIDTVVGSGDTAALFTDLMPSGSVAAGQELVITASFDTAGLLGGPLQAVYTITVSDEDISGAGAGADLVLTLVGVGVPPIPTLSQWAMIVQIQLVLVVGALMFRRSGRPCRTSA